MTRELQAQFLVICINLVSRHFFREAHADQCASFLRDHPEFKDVGEELFDCFQRWGTDVRSALASGLGNKTGIVLSFLEPVVFQ